MRVRGLKSDQGLSERQPAGAARQGAHILGRQKPLATSLLVLDLRHPTAPL